MLALALAALCVAAPARADGQDDRRALVLLRVLSYDRNLVTRAADRVTILVVYDEPAGAEERDRWLVALAGTRKITVADREVVTRTHKFKDQARLATVVGELQATAIVVCGGLDQSLPAIRAVARAHHAMTFTTRESEVAAGFSVGLVAGDHRDVIAINPGAARAEGVQFEAGLLKIAKRIGKDEP
jgi:hypothetical protein